MEDFRCSVASLADDESIAGSAPIDNAWIFVEYAGPWGRAAVAESRLSERVRAWLGALDGFRVQLIRRAGRGSPGVRVLAATATPTGFAVGSTALPDHEALVGLVLDPALPGAGLPAYADPLWLVCTNGRRDRCCAELGRPVLEALAEVWPGETWETTHLGGHRFAGTLLALPSGITLGRLTGADAVAACQAVAKGGPPESMRGRAGLSPAAQVAVHHLRATHPAAGAWQVVEREPGQVEVATSDASYVVTVVSRPGPARRQSCADDRTKPTILWSVDSVRRRGTRASRDG